jgi:plasmid stabilization system protein ParE
VPRTLTYAPQAIGELVAVRRWLTPPGSGAAARRKLTAIIGAIADLAEYPRRFRVHEHDAIRELPCASGYRVLYEVLPDTGRNETAGNVRVLRVFGPGLHRGLISKDL